MEKMISFKSSGQIELLGKSETIPLTFLGVQNDSLLSYQFTSGGLPTVIVDDSVFKRMKNDMDPALQTEYTYFIGFDIINENHQEHATRPFYENV